MIKNKYLKLVAVLLVLLGLVLPKTYSVYASEVENQGEAKTIFLKEQKNYEASIDVENWMKLYAQDETPIGLLSIPGTHNSTAFDTWAMHAVARPWALTQEKDIIQQLYMGVRYFDFRSKEDFYMWHGSINVGHDLLRHFREVTEFLDSHPSEFVIIRLKTENGNTEKFVNRLNDEIFSNDSSDIRPYFAINPKPNSKVKDLRGKIVLLNQVDSRLNLNTLSYHSISKQDNWRPYSYEKKIEDIMNFSKSIQGSEELTLNHVSFSYPPKTVWNTAVEMNQRVSEYLDNNYYDLKNTGVMIFDYPTDKIIMKIIERNQLSRRHYLKTNPITITAKEKYIDKDVLLTGIENIPYEDISKITFDALLSTEVEKNVKVKGVVTFIDGSFQKIVIPVNITKEEKIEEIKNTINIYKYNATQKYNKGTLKNSFESNTLVVNIDENENKENKILKEFFYKYYDLSNVVDSQRANVNRLINYARSEFIEPKNEYKFYLSELQEIKFEGNMLYIESYYEDGTHVIVEMPVKVD